MVLCVLVILPGEVLPKVSILGAFAVVFFGIGVWRFRFE